MRLLVTGAAGMLGTDVVAAAGRAGHDVLALARTDLDVLDAAAVRAAVGDARPDAVVNCAAYTDVDGAEAEEAAATALNGAAAGHVAAAAHAAGAFTVQVSSDYVFDGRGASRTWSRRRPRRSAPTGAPSSRASTPSPPRPPARTPSPAPPGCSAPTGRTSSRRCSGSRASATRSPSSTTRSAAPPSPATSPPALIALAEARAAGIHHVAGGGACSWYDLAAATFAARGLDVELARGRTADLGRPAPRPAYSVLRTERADTPVLPPWQQGLHAYLEETVTA